MSYARKIVLVGLWITITVLRSNCYNLEDRLPLFKYGKAGSSFGFSVAQHRLTKSAETGVEGTVLVVGAPTAEASSSASVQYTRPGGVYYCPVSTDPDDCKRVELDTTDEPPASQRIEVIKSGQWLGVSLRSQGPGEFLVTCAHRYRWQVTSVARPNREEEYVCGKCFLMKGTNAGNVVEIPRLNATLTKDFISSPCEFLRSNGNQIYSKTRFGYTQAGTSLALADSEYLLGGPGAWRWSGALFAIKMPEMRQTVGEPTPPPSQSSRVPNFYQSMTCPVSEWRNQPDKRKCNEFPLNRDSYMGFSVAMSESILPNSKEIFYIAGAPRGNNSGAVVFLRKRTGYADFADLRPDVENIVLGEATSSSFGYSVATTDLNGDGLDDLIVGAPQYYEHSSKRKAGGAVYVYINEAGVGFRHIKPRVFYGPKESHFGQTVAALGDIDQDGYGDFAVGAPYQDQYGVVHIYRGSANGIVKKSQTIFGKDYGYISVASNQDLIGFGASLSGYVDADGNKYPDLLIGSLSNHVTLIRARPIIEVHMTFEVDRNEIDLEEKDCDATWSCFKITYCFEYTARHAEYTGAVQLSYRLMLDSIMQKAGKTARAVIHNSTASSIINNNVTLPAAGTKICPGKKLKAIFLTHTEDHLSDIEVEIEHDLVIPEVKREKRGAPVFNMIKDPILDADFNKTRSEVVRIKNTCGDDGCQSNLKFNATMPREIVLVRITATNNKEEAHQASFTLTIPEDVTFSSASTLTSKNITCGQVKSDLLLCEIGNPFKSGEIAELTVYFDVTGLQWERKEIQFELDGYTTSQNSRIDPISLYADIILELDIIVTGSGFPQQVQYKQKEILGELGMNKTDQIGSLITYTFNAANRGTYTAPELKMSFSLPSEIYNGKWLLYLVATEVTFVDGKTAGYCSDKDGNVNVLGLEPSYAGRTRSKRAARIQAVIPTGSKNVFQAVLSCGDGATNCINVNCSLEKLPPNERISVKLYARLWEATFLEEKSLRTLDLVHIDTLSHISTAFENVRLNTNVAKVRTTVDHDFFKDDLLSAFPWWYIFIALILLLLIYMLIILVLIRCGFFRRKRYSRKQRASEGVVQEQPSA